MAIEVDSRTPTVRVIDSSAILAILFDETGAEQAKQLGARGVISSVNLYEIIFKCGSKSFGPDDVMDFLDGSGYSIAPFDEAMAIIAADIKRLDSTKNLSLADCACLACAISLGMEIVTADRAWTELQLPCKINVIR